MTDSERSVLRGLSAIVEQILAGKKNIVSKIDAIDDDSDEIIKQIAGQIVTLGELYRDAYGFILDLAAGRLNCKAPSQNPIIGPFKQLHSELRHLTWQIQEIANGDYDQSVSFSGDFSEAINKMIVALRERQILADINKENEFLFRSIFSTSPDGIIICDMDNRIVNLSNKAIAMLSLSEKALSEGIRFTDLIEDDDKEIGLWFFKNIAEGKQTFAEMRVTKGNGTCFWSEQNASVLYDAGGHPKGFILIIRDITERKVSEEQLIKYAGDLDESNKNKDRLFSIIAHDLKNPFNALLGFSKFLLEETETGDMAKIRQYAGIIRDTASHTYDLLNNLLDWSRIQTNRITVSPEPVDLQEIIDSNIGVGQAVALAKNIIIGQNRRAYYPVMTDKAIVNTILRNLISNAIKYTPEDGSITILIEPHDTGYRLSVQDTGQGIRPEDIGKLFRNDVIYSTPGTNNEKGTGLGLILCKDFVNKINGTIGVESECGKGATFTFTVPNMAAQTA